MKLHKLSPGGVLTRLSAPERDVEVSVDNVEMVAVDVRCRGDVPGIFFISTQF